MWETYYPLCILLLLARKLLLVARLLMNDSVRIDGDHMILIDGLRLPIVALVCIESSLRAEDNMIRFVVVDVPLFVD